MKLCDIKCGSYYETRDEFIFRVESIYKQENTSNVLFEIDDWKYGDNKKLMNISNDNRLIKLTSSELEDVSEVSGTRFDIREYEAMIDLVKTVSSRGPHYRPMKRNEKRTTLFNILIKYHRMTHEEC